MLTAFNCRSEDVRARSIIIADLELGDIEGQILFARLVESADHAALDQRPEAFNCIGMDRADDTLHNILASVSGWTAFGRFATAISLA